LRTKEKRKLYTPKNDQKFVCQKLSPYVKTDPVAVGGVCYLKVEFNLLSFTGLPLALASVST
jgi:hypothetical protein